MTSLLLALALCASAAEPSLTIEAKGGDGPWAAGPVSPLKGQSVRLRVPPGRDIRWYQVIPDVSKMYKNANFPWERDAYKWVGLARIRYDVEELAELRGKAEVELFAPAGPTRWTREYASDLVRSPYYRPDAGSFWFSAVVDGRRSAGREDADRHGLPPSVMRVTVREGPGFLGHLSGFFNVPALFGSIPVQSSGYLGADCADAVMAARGKWLGKDPERNYNVAALVSELPRVAEFDLEGGTVSRRVAWGTVRPGDLAAIRYKGARGYQHVGALVADADGDGVLSADDAMLHAGPWPLAYAALGSGPFDGRVTVLRPKGPIVERPIRFTERRRRLTEEYAAAHYGRGIAVEPRLIVLHWTGVASLEASFRTFDREELEGRGDIAAGGKVNVSAHFLVDRDGTIYRLMPETLMARHVIGLNTYAVGAENVGGAGGRDDLTDAQVSANAWLVRDLKERFPGIRHLIGHHEYLAFEGTELWLEKDAAYRTRKSDPGDAFLRKVRARVADLGLTSAPLTDDGNPSTGVIRVR